MDFLIPETPIGPEELIEKNLFNFTLNFKANNNINFSLSEIGNNKLKLIAIEINDEFNKYETILELEKLKNDNKYFTKFNNYEDFKNDFIKLCNSKNGIRINYYNFDRIELNIDLKFMSSDIITLILKKVEMSQKEQIKYLLKSQNEKNEIINNLVLKNKEMENNLKLKENDINQLKIENCKKTNDINQLKIENYKKTNEIKQIKQELLQLQNIFFLMTKYLNNNEKEKKKINDIDINNRVQEIYNRLEDEFYISSFKTEEEIKKKIIELNLDNEKIDEWIESIM